MNIHTEMPNGATSKGYEYATEEEAIEAFFRVKSQLVEMGFVGDLVICDAGIDLRRESINAAG